MSNNRLLLLGCSRRKKPDHGLLPALERYDGPAFRVLRKALREGVSAPETVVLSAAYGLIPAQQPIRHYDQVLDAERATLLARTVGEALLTYRDSVREIFVCMGKRYWKVLAPMLEETEISVRYATGSIGRQSSQLKRWLSAADPVPPPIHESKGKVILRGRKILYSSDEVARIAKVKAERDPTGATRCATWVAVFGSLRVAPKWLVSQLSGLEVSQFRTADALRVLQRLGVEVQQI